MKFSSLRIKAQRQWCLEVEETMWRYEEVDTVWVV